MSRQTDKFFARHPQFLKINDRQRHKHSASRETFNCDGAKPALQRKHTAARLSGVGERQHTRWGKSEHAALLSKERAHRRLTSTTATTRRRRDAHDEFTLVGGDSDALAAATAL